MVTTIVASAVFPHRIVVILHRFFRLFVFFLVQVPTLFKNLTFSFVH